MLYQSAKSSTKVVVLRGVLAVGLLASTTIAAPKSEAPAHPLDGSEINEAQIAAVTKGLAALAAKQSPDGSFSGDAGITALCAMAFMQNGNLPGRGKYGPQVEAALNLVVNSTQESGLISTSSPSSPMYGHGFATLFLAEAYGMSGDERVKEKLQKAVKLIQQSQNSQGGWRYTPAPVDADISVTICQVMALRAARDAGIKVEKEVIDNAINYVRKCQNSDGGFSYVLNQSSFGGGSGFARTGAGLASLYYAGVSKGKEVERALGYLRKFGSRGDSEGNFFYAHYYVVQAMYLAGGEDWRNWYPRIRDQLITRQDKATGIWKGENSDEYSTAMALLILQMPNRYLPVYSGKGPGS